VDFHIYSPYEIFGYGGISIGNNVHINRYAYIQGAGGLVIGNNVHIGPHLTLYTTSHDYNGSAIPYDENVMRKKVIIEDNVWIGARVTIVPGVKIGEGAIIAAGTVLVKDVEPLQIIGGNGQRVLKTRNEKHYYKLKANTRFGGIGGKLYENIK
jgi:maltose O-acetyltransferase